MVVLSLILPTLRVAEKYFDWLSLLSVGDWGSSRLSELWYDAEQPWQLDPASYHGNSTYGRTRQPPLYLYNTYTMKSGSLLYMHIATMKVIFFSELKKFYKAKIKYAK